MIVRLLKVIATAWNLLMVIISIIILLGYIRNSDTRGIIATVQMIIMQSLTITAIWRRQVQCISRSSRGKRFIS